MAGADDPGGARGAIDAPADALAVTGRIALGSGRVVEATPGPGGADVLRVIARDGQCVLTVSVTDQGPVLRFAAASIEIASIGALDLACRELRVRVDGDASLAVGGDLREHVEGEVARRAGGASSIAARSIAFEADPGGVVVRANDDVDLKGERVLLNSDDPPMPLTVEEYRARLAQRSAAALAPPGDDPPRGVSQP